MKLPTVNKTSLMNNAKFLTFIHGRQTNVIINDIEGHFIAKIEDVDPDYFLNHFDYGQDVCEDETQIKRFLSELF